MPGPFAFMNIHLIGRRTSSTCRHRTYTTHVISLSAIKDVPESVSCAERGMSKHKPARTSQHGEHESCVQPCANRKHNSIAQTPGTLNPLWLTPSRASQVAILHCTCSIAVWSGGQIRARTERLTSDTLLEAWYKREQGCDLLFKHDA